MHTEDSIVVVGAGGHAKVVVEAIRACGPLAVSVVDDSPDAVRQSLLGIAVGGPAVPPSGVGAFHVAIGGNSDRARKFAEFESAGLRPMTVAHPLAAVSPSADVQPGAFLAAHAVLGAQCAVGAGAIVNHGAVVDHDCSVGDFAHVAPNATLCGGVRIGRLALIGSGAVVLPGICVGVGAVVGAGAVVRHDILDGRCVAGVPAREI